MTKLIELLHAGNYSCVVENCYGLHTFSRRGVADLYEVYREHAEWLDHASLADKVIGKGAAALMVLGGVERVYADVISTPALMLLREAGIAVTFGAPHRKSDENRVVPVGVGLCRFAGCDGDLSGYQTIYGENRKGPTKCPIAAELMAVVGATQFSVMHR